MTQELPQDVEVVQAGGQSRLGLRTALVLALIALLAVTWQWVSTRRHFTQIEQSLSEKLAKFEANNQQSLTVSKMADERSVAASAELAVLRQQLAESQNQQEALQTLYEQLAGNREARVVTEAEQLMVIANQQLQLASNVKSALLALQTAYSRLQSLDSKEALALRESLAQDITKLQNLPLVDVAEMSAQLEELARNVDKLTLVSDRHPKPKKSATKDENANVWAKLTQEVWQDMRNIIRLERIDRPEPPLLDPEQVFFLKENIKLRLLTARIALLQHDEATYRADIKTVRNWLSSHFDTRENGTVQALNRIGILSANSIAIQIPDISESLNLVSKYKLSLETKAEIEPQAVGH